MKKKIIKNVVIFVALALGVVFIVNLINNSYYKFKDDKNIIYYDAVKGKQVVHMSIDLQESYDFDEILRDMVLSLTDDDEYDDDIKLIRIRCRYN